MARKFSDFYKKFAAPLGWSEDFVWTPKPNFDTHFDVDEVHAPIQSGEMVFLVADGRAAKVMRQVDGFADLWRVVAEKSCGDMINEEILDLPRLAFTFEPFAARRPS